jgi:hypothetical protein
MFIGQATLWNKGNAKRGVSPRLKIRPCDLDLWPWKSIGFQILIRSKNVPSLVKIHWRMLILECSQGCYAVKIWPLDLWPWKSIGFQTLLRTKYVPSLVKIHWRMLILVFTRMLCGKNLTPWPLTLKINRVPDSPKDYLCTKLGQNPLKDIDSRVFTRMLCVKNLTRWHWPLTYDLENQ